jgi:uncharacterized protein (DUF1697 family)
VILLEVEQLARIIADNPFPEGESEPALLAVGFLAAVPEQPDLEALEAVRKRSERFALGGEVFYFHVVKLMAMAKAMGWPSSYHGLRRWF